MARTARKSMARTLGTSLLATAAIGALVATTAGALGVSEASAQSSNSGDSLNLPPLSSGPAGSVESAETIARSSLGLIANGSLLNSDAPTLAPLSTGVAPLSTASMSGPAGSLVTPALMGSTLAMSLIPVGSLASGTQILGTLLGPDAVTRGVGSLTGPGYAVPKPNPDITETKVVRKKTESNPNVRDGLEVWTVSSAKMQREVDVEVYLPTDESKQQDANVLYYLDGVDTLNPSGFRTLTSGPNRVRDANVIGVAPTGAPGSNWTEWNQDDPHLGRNKWDTFLTEEFPQILDEEVGKNEDRKYGVTGVSMGAGSALQVAAAKPGFFATAGGVSGCYSTTSDLGYETLRLSIETRGGNMTNMWGPRNAPEWQARNLPDHPEKLQGTKVFMSAATGAIGAEDAKRYGSDPGVLFSGYVLEAGTRECTNQMDSALKGAGVEHETFLMPTGVHNWSTFTPGFDKAMDYMLPELAQP
ncbi:alpha/beta hydrolase [Dietzia timorensis]|uniref:Protein PS1 n=1 Tax=Dietzia timorensis TaxID=499555 RepID=A0A173LNE7_9ACTN|nr:alpha/beta hydrolase-fold protein [Dietzia timorensis]ANI93158.1 Protein PS1 [Dietzia timorensis]